MVHDQLGALPADAVDEAGCFGPARDRESSATLPRGQLSRRGGIGLSVGHARKTGIRDDAHADQGVLPLRVPAPPLHA